MTSYFARGELARLRRLRERLISIESRAQGTPAPRYWESPQDLELYDAFFAQRIGWKWRAVLDELDARGRRPSGEHLLDWGCGTGIAAREWLRGADENVQSVTLWDRDPKARAFAAARLTAEYPDIELRVATQPPKGTEADVLLVSHVLDELEDGDVDPLLEIARNASATVWVEPGSRLTSRRLGAVRDALLDVLVPLAPCTHRERCGVLAIGQERNWCHLFARPPQDVFTEGRWSEFGRELGIDLRSVPYSFVALAKDLALEAPAGGARLLGRPRRQRGRALIDTCEASGLRSESMLQRLNKPLFKTLGETAGEALVLDIEREGERITHLERRTFPRT